MSLFRRNDILKTIQQFSETMSQIESLKEAQDHAAALELVEDQLRRIVGPLSGTIDRVTGASVMMLMGDAKRVRVYGLLLAERSMLLAMLGNPVESQRVAHRANDVLSSWQNTTHSNDAQVQRALEILRHS